MPSRSTRGLDLEIKEVEDEMSHEGDDDDDCDEDDDDDLEPKEEEEEEGEEEHGQLEQVHVSGPLWQTARLLLCNL